MSKPQQLMAVHNGEFIWHISEEGYFFWGSPAARLKNMAEERAQYAPRPKRFREKPPASTRKKPRRPKLLGPGR